MLHIATHYHRTCRTRHPKKNPSQSEEDPLSQFCFTRRATGKRQFKQKMKRKEKKKEEEMEQKEDNERNRLSIKQERKSQAGGSTKVTVFEFTVCFRLLVILWVYMKDNAWHLYSFFPAQYLLP